MRKILVGLFGSHLNPTMIHCDNQSCIKLSINPVFHDRSMLRLQQDDELSGKELPSLSGPAGYFWHKVYF